MSAVCVSLGRAHRRGHLIPLVAGIGFTLSWVAGLLLPVPNLAVSAPATEVIARYGPHLGDVQTQFLLTEGLPAIGLAVTAVALARRAGQAAHRVRGRVIAVAGLAAAVISLAQYALGVTLAGSAVPDQATGRVETLWQALNRLDGVKMFALAGLALGAVALAAPGGPLPRWLRYAGLALAISIAVSGVGYLFLIQALAPVAYVSGAALLVWVTGTGVALGTRKRDACPERD